MCYRDGDDRRHYRSYFNSKSEHECERELQRQHDEGRRADNIVATAAAIVVITIPRRGRIGKSQCPVEVVLRGYCSLVGNWVVDEFKSDMNLDNGRSNDESSSDWDF